MSDVMWKKCADFHGHVCGGLTIGYKASLYAIELLGVSTSEDEELVCISENDACGVDAIQAILECTIGKGNLLFHMTGKQAFSFYDRNNGKSIRLVLRPAPEGMTREDSFEYYQGCQPNEMFDVKETFIGLPEKAKIFRSYSCSSCEEKASENMIRLQGDQTLCLDCYKPYSRFKI